MIAMLACALLLNEWADPPLTVHLSIDQDGGLSALQVRLAVDEMRKIWKDARVDVTSGPFGEPSRPEEAGVSLRILRIALPVNHAAERVLAWVTPAGTGRSAPLLFVSLPAIMETVMGTEAFDLPFRKLTRDLRDRLLAQAIGRVAAHELGHYLLQKAGHQNRGLMRPMYSANELVGDWLEPFQIPNAQQSNVRHEIEALAHFQARVERVVHERPVTARNVKVEF